MRNPPEREITVDKLLISKINIKLKNNIITTVIVEKIFFIVY